MTRAPADPADPKGLIREAYLIDAITAPECRSIFLDWALSLEDAGQAPAAIADLLARYAAAAPNHPMTVTLQAGLGPQPTPRRRGGRSGRGVH
ncbi:MAG: hypothetical protein GW886_09695 [Rhodobacterales bacterium]|nr:hypothetical protein [Rhodobacterales bacterium]